MSITDYAELQTAVGKWLNRGDADTLERIPEFIELVDARLNRLQLTREVKELFLDNGSGELSFNSFAPGTGPTSSIPLTESMTNLRSLVLFCVEHADAPGTFKPPLTAPGVVLVSPELLYEHRSVNVTARMPFKAAVLPDRIVLSPLPDAVYRWQIRVEVHEALSDALPTNTVLDTAPDVYLYGALVESAPYLKDDERLPVWEQRFLSAIEELQQARERTEWPNTPIAPQPRVF